MIWHVDVELELPVQERVFDRRKYWKEKFIKK